jgi:Tol biopolymer transport system component
LAFVWSGEKRDNTDLYIKPVAGGTPLRLTTDPGEDTAPAWSPDGGQIAFVRRNGRQAAIYLTPPVPASERKLVDFRPANTTTSTIVGQMVTMSWFPDGAWLAVPAQEDDNTYGIVAIPASGGEPRRLTSTREGRHQFPAFSPDGTVLAYAMCVIDSVCDVHAVSLGPRLETRGPPRRLTHQRAGIQGMTWAADGRSLIYSSRLDGQHLWRVALSGAEPERLEIAGTPAVYPAVARAGEKLAFIRQGSGDSDLWKFENGAPPESILSSTLSDYAPQWSPDGRRIAFVSDRSGRGPQIWAANKDGTNLTPITDSSGRSQGTPRWSPDGRWIAYDAQGDEGTTHIYVIEADGGRPRRLTTDAGTEQFPSWSRDGQFVYYRSSMGDWRIWRTPIRGGSPQAMTEPGGRSAWESWDGRRLFYVRDGGLWAKPLAGGPILRLLPSVYQWDFFPVDGGVYYVLQPDPRRRYDLELRYLDLATGLTRLLSKFQSQEGNGLSVSPDGRTVLYSGVRMSAGDDLMVILNFR